MAGDATKGQRFPQIMAIAIICGIYYMIIHEAVNDISFLIQNHPNDFWLSFLRYVISNLAQGYGGGAV
jgi:uncharacterized protein involved in cysteine biosynthesis